MLDLDPQSNLTLYGLDDNRLQDIWVNEEKYVNEGFPTGSNTLNSGADDALLASTRSVHFLLKPVEVGVDDYNKLPPPCELFENLYLIPGSITLSQFEGVLAERWVSPTEENILSIRTMTQFRTIAKRYSSEYEFDFVLADVSPSLGLLNRAIITTSDAFFMPATPDLFSMYGIRNIGQSLRKWENSFKQIASISQEGLRNLFPSECVKFLGYTIYNAKKRADQKMELAGAHRNYAERIPKEVENWIPSNYVAGANITRIAQSIGGNAVWHTHNTYPALAQKYKCPIWHVPDATLEKDDKSTVTHNQQRFYETRGAYFVFVDDLLSRM